MQKRGSARLEGAEAFDAAAGGDDDHLARLDLAHEFRADDVERAGLRTQHPAVADPAQHQRAHAQRIAHADQLGAGHGDDGKRAFDPAQRVLHPLGDGFCSERAIRWMMHSLSEEDWKIEPRSISSRRSASALVMLPLWAIAAPPMANSPKKGCTSRIWVAPLEPAVE
jgi:hypothetical protein